MHPLDVLADPVRRRLLELLREGERPSGALVEAARGEFGISQPAVSQHLKVLREHGFVHVRAEGQRRIYVLDRRPFALLAEWLATFQEPWEARLDALETEVARGRRERRDRPARDAG